MFGLGDGLKLRVKITGNVKVSQGKGEGARVAGRWRVSVKGKGRGTLCPVGRRVGTRAASRTNSRAGRKLMMYELW